MMSTNQKHLRVVLRLIIQYYVRTLNIDLPPDYIGYIERMLDDVNMSQFGDRELLDRMDIKYIEKYLREKKLEKINKK